MKVTDTECRTITCTEPPPRASVANTPGVADAGFVARARFRRRSVMFVVRRHEHTTQHNKKKGTRMNETTKLKCLNVSWAIESVCLLLLAAGWLAEQAGWMRIEWSRIIPIFLVVQLVAVTIGVLPYAQTAPKRKAEPGAAPNAGPTTPSGSSGVAGGPPSVS